jgi:hypothetical protein
MASKQLSWDWGVPGMVGSALVMGAVTYMNFKQKAPELKNPGPVMISLGLLTWGFVIWQTWMWFHPAIPPVQGNTQAQMEDYAAKKVALATKPLSDQIAQITKEIEGLRQGSPETAKIISGLRSQIAQLQSDTPVNVDKLPTSLQLHFTSNDIEEISSKNIIWAKIFGWRERKNILTTQGYAGWTIVIVFKKPITYKGIHYEDHGAGLATITASEENRNSRYAVIELDSIYLNGLLLDINFDNSAKGVK